MRIVRADYPEWEQVVYAEVLIPGVPNVYGDIWTEDAIKEAAYAYLRAGILVDINHNNETSDLLYVVESFIARNNDPDFIRGSWVVALKIEDPETWDKVLNNELNGFSYEALVAFIDGSLTLVDNYLRTGVVTADLTDGHTHNFMVKVDANNRPVSGGTDEVNGHWHSISRHSVTGEAAGHTHRYNLVTDTAWKI